MLVGPVHFSLHDLVPVQLQTLQGGDIAIPKMEKKFAKRRFMPHF